MKAFLSHSSKDKHFVRGVAKHLGNLQIEYDEYTFDYTLNAQAIRQALGRSSLFVLFLSANSVKSSFVAEEVRAVLESRAKGSTKQVLIFAIDQTSYRELPEWLREINVVQRLSNERACSRKIQATLIALQSQESHLADTYLGREEDEKDLRKALAAPPGEAPVALHAVGHFGIGRRTFLRQTLTKIFPRDFAVFVEVPLQSFEGAEEFYRRLYGLHRVFSVEESSRDFETFAKLPQKDQVERIADILVEMSSQGELVVIDDQNGVYTDEGTYQPYLKALINELAGSPKPILGVVQNRMMPFAIREAQKVSYHRFLRPLSDESIAELLSFSLKDAGVDFTGDDLAALSEFIDGHPFNVRFVTKAIKSYGLQSFLADPRDLVEWKVKRGEDFLRLLKLSDTECELVAALSEYRFLPLELLSSIVNEELTIIVRALRNLEECCLIERRSDYYQISAPLRDAVRRDKRFERTDRWRQTIANLICESLQQYKGDDHVPVTLIESGVLAAVRGAKAPAFITALVLPSHLLSIARSFYDKRNYKACVEFCKRAYELKGRLTVEAEIELLRLWGLSLARPVDAPEWGDVIANLERINTKTAKRFRFFLEGFRLRMRDQLDEAEEKFLESWKLGRDNQSVNRELASLYCKQKRYAEAEEFARSAYRSAPTNPFIIDILAECLMGRANNGLTIDYAELERLIQELRIYGDAPGSSFFLIRQAQALARARDYTRALAAVERAVERTPALLSPYFIRADISLTMNDVTGAEADLKTIEGLLEKRGGFSEGDEAQVQELRARILIAKEQFSAAKTAIENSAFLTKAMKRRLLPLLARAVGFAGERADRNMLAWAKSFGGSR